MSAAGKKLIQEHPWEDEPSDPSASPRIVGVFDAVARGEPAIEDPNLQLELQADLRKMLDLVARARITPTSGPATPSEETMQKLRALGYTK